MATDETCTYGLDGYKTVIAASDAVLIACASKYHSFYAEEAVKAGKHVFVEKPHAIDPAGCVRMRRACELAKKKGVSVVSGHESRYDVAYQEQVKRIHDGAIGKVVAIQSMFLRPPYSTVSRDPKLSEMEYQFSNWYHFRWLSGDDVTQSLVHNLDRMRWVLHEENPTSCFGLGGRSTSFGEVYGDMFDHHTVVYEFASGPRLYALCQTRAGCYQSWDDIIMGTKGICHWTDCRIEGETKWRYEGPRNVSHVEEQKILIGAIREGNWSTTATRWSTARTWPSWARWPATTASRSPGSRSRSRTSNSSRSWPTSGSTARRPRNRIPRAIIRCRSPA